VCAINPGYSHQLLMKESAPFIKGIRYLQQLIIKRPELPMAFMERAFILLGIP